MFKNPDLAEKYFLKPLLVDYGQYSDQELLKHGEISGLEIAFKHAFDDTIADDVITSLMLGLKKCAKIELIRNWYMYALKTWETPAKTMLEKYREYLTDDEVFVMTAAEQLKQQGIQIGFDQGIEKGIEKGALESKKETAINMLNQSLSDEIITRCTGLEKSIIEELKKVALKSTHH